ITVDNVRQPSALSVETFLELSRSRRVRSPRPLPPPSHSGRILRAAPISAEVIRGPELAPWRQGGEARKRRQLSHERQGCSWRPDGGRPVAARPELTSGDESRSAGGEHHRDEDESACCPSDHHDTRYPSLLGWSRL